MSIYFQVELLQIADVFLFGELCWLKILFLKGKLDYNALKHVVKWLIISGENIPRNEIPD